MSRSIATATRFPWVSPIPAGAFQPPTSIGCAMNSYGIQERPHTRRSGHGPGPLHRQESGSSVRRGLADRQRTRRRQQVHGRAAGQRRETGRGTRSSRHVHRCRPGGAPQRPLKLALTRRSPSGHLLCAGSQHATISPVARAGELPGGTESVQLALALIVTGGL